MTRMEMMDLISRINLLLKLKERDYPFLSKKLGMEEESLKEILRRGDITPSFANQIALALGVEKEVILNEDSKDLPLGVFDFKVGEGYKKSCYDSLFSLGTSFFYFGIGFFVFFLFLIRYQERYEVSYLVGVLFSFIIILISLLYPLVVLFLIPKGIKGEARIVLYMNDVYFYERKEGKLVRSKTFPVSNISFVVETPKAFSFSVYKHGLMFLPKGNMANEELKTIRAKFMKESLFYFVKGKVDFNEFSKMSTYERNKKKAFLSDLYLFFGSLIGIIALFLGLCSYLSKNLDIWHSLGYGFLVTLILCLLMGLYFLYLEKKEERKKNLVLGIIYLMLSLNSLIMMIISFVL